MDLKPKTLNDVIDVFDVYNVNMITGLVMGNLREDRRILEAFVDCTEASIPVGEITEMLRKIPGVFTVECVGATENYVVCKLHYPPKVLGEEAVVFRLSILKSWFTRIWKVFGSGAAQIFYEAGLESGREAAKYFREKLGLTGEVLADFLAGIASSLGWGKIVDLSFNPERREARVKIENLFECMLAGRVGEPRGFFFRGHVLGMARELFGTEALTVEETKCIARGDPYCEFQVKPL